MQADEVDQAVVTDQGGDAAARRPVADSPRRRMVRGPVLAGLLPLVVVGITLAGFGLAARPPAAPVSWGDLLQERPLVVPAARPPGLIDLWSSSSVDPALPASTWYSRNQPLVSLCLGQPDSCRSTMGMADVIRSEVVGGRQVTIGVVRPGSAAATDDDLLRYWRTVPLVDVSGQPSAEPPWLAEDSPISR